MGQFYFFSPFDVGHTSVVGIVRILFLLTSHSNSLLKVMAATGLTFLLGEYNTSKMCPCGTDELITPKGGANGKRVRVHKTSGDACSVLQLVDDRDETADVNFGLAALNSVRGYAWPSHLCSSCSATT